jgi:outer membrane protein OmpA-like peptidoglycan-associated protein/ABC-type nitrate/sulfonate/bicarbonate transport system substrate-binding protein
MSGHLKVFVSLLVVGLLLIVGAKFVLPMWQDAEQRSTSDAGAAHGSLTVGVDSWVGYFPLCSPAMSKRMREAGYNLRCDDDAANYARRFERLGNGELQLAVSTVDAYVLNGVKSQYPGAIVAVLDQSKGGDAIVARRSAVANLDALKQKPSLRIAFTPNSPSDHLLKAVGVHFDVPHLKDRKGSWRVVADGSADALKKLQSGDVDVAVLWEPDVSRALADGQFVKLIGSEDTENLIVDVLIASRTLVQEKPEAIAAVLDHYFQTLSQYRNDDALLHEQVRAYAKVDATQVAAMLRGVAWASLNDNGVQWLGVLPASAGGEQRLVDVVNDSTQIMISAGDFDGNPLPDRDAYRITNGQFIAKLFNAGAGGNAGPASAQKSFTPLDERAWSALQEVGTLKIEPIGFQRGAASLNEDGEQALARMMDRLRHYPNYRILVKGHTGSGGDADANMELSKLRAQTVASHLLSAYGMDANRLRAVGFGSSLPLPRLANESDRAYDYRLPRVEVVLLADPY